MRTPGAWRPDTIYHAAAYKHVPMVETQSGRGHPQQHLRHADHGAPRARVPTSSDFVLISTDKAVRPTNVMGASKRLAEMVLQALRAAGRRHALFSIVRFGNVLGSSGSVVPLFRRQIAHGGPITITHPEMTRYFMTIPEAAQLVIQASAMASGGDVFLLDMGEPVKIADLARRMVELSGMTVRDAGNPGGDIEFVITGLRPGEKLYEELLIGDKPLPTGHPRVMKGRESFPEWNVFQTRLEQLSEVSATGDSQKIRGILALLVAGYTPSAPEESTTGRSCEPAEASLTSPHEFALLAPELSK